MAQATAAPQSCPTTWAFSTPAVVEHGEHVGDQMAEAVGVDRLRLVGIAEAALIGCNDPETRIR